MKPGPLAAALLCCTLGASLQWLTVHFNYGGNATALFMHGSQFPLPAGLASEHIYVFPNSGGYDGQSYHYIAHDPFERSDIGRAVPDPSLRYPRILVPGMAYLLALGRPAWIDASFFACNLFFLGLGAYWLAILLRRIGIRPMFAALYVIVPVAIVSLDRMLVDLALASLALGFAVYVRPERPVELYLILAAAALCRESGFFLFAAWAIHLAWQRRFRQIAIYATATLPGIAWILWVRTQIPGAAALGLGVFVPFSGMVDAALHPRGFPFSPLVVAVIHATYALQIAGILLAIVLAFRDWRRVAADPLRTACLLWALYAIVIPPGIYDDPISSPRVLAPLLLFQFLQNTRVSRLPLLLVAPRVWLELAPQFLGILHGI
ncbi:MAG: hypothetical protein JWP63_136 [Candidatus Solibacter sp.]|nr:hypothetical protein [Candidatus Solibacter sp.]